MKTLLALCLVLGCNFPAFAGNEGPQAVPTKASKIAEYNVSAYFGPASMTGFFSFQIYSNGFTKLIRQKRGDGATTVTKLEAYNKEDTAVINALVAEIRPGKLFDPNPSAPGCMDAPSIRVSVFKNNEEIVIDERIACKRSDRENRSHADEKLIDILSELSRTGR